MFLTVLLTILKILGIVIGSILGFVLLLVLLVLFVPIRYKISFVRTAAQDDPPVDAKGYVSWLLHIVHVSFWYPDRESRYVYIRVFGIPIFRLPLTEEEKLKAEEKRLKKEEKLKEQAAVTDKPSDEAEQHGNEDGHPADETAQSADATDKPPDETAQPADEADQPADETAQPVGETEQPADDEDQSGEEEEERSIFGRIADLVRKIVYTIRESYDKIKNSVVQISDRMEKLKRDIHYYHTILTSELFERTLEKTKKRVHRLLKSLAPRKCDIALEVGFDDPYTTGEVMAIAGILYPFTGDHVRVNCNFDEEIIKGAGLIKGRIFICVIVWTGLLYLFDRDFKKLIRLFRKQPPKKRKRRKHIAKKEVNESIKEEYADGGDQ